METAIKHLDQNESEGLRSGDVAQVWVATPIDRPFDYLVEDPSIPIGAIVEVPFGARRLRGVVWARGDATIKRDKLKSILGVLPLTPLATPMRDFIERMAHYTLTPIGQILPMVIRTPGPPVARPQWIATLPEFDGPLTPKRAAAIAQIKETPRDPKSLDVSRGILNTLVEIGAARWVDQPTQPAPSIITMVERLTSSQQDALSAMQASDKPIVLKGITGSGKTEVYLELIADALRDGGQALVLLPEISLTTSFIERFEARFGERPAHWHSAMSTKDRRQIWHDVSTGQARIVIGARSALFLPFDNLRLIVVDEEHDRGYKQDEGVIYNGRDMAVLRGAIEGARVVLASATPSIETMVNAQQDRYTLVTLEQRYGSAQLPTTRIVDMNQAGLDANHFIAPEVNQAIEKRLERGEQSLLFLNRRGFAPLTLCRACGHQLGCPNCDTRMVEHRHQNRLQCHQCGHQAAVPMNCPECDAEDRLVALGPGVERIAHEVQDRFPAARTIVLSSDMNFEDGDAATQIAAIARGEYDIIIGTQMVAKGHNFPMLTLVGIIDADIGLEGGDLRAAEASFQILRQVTGRAGRAEHAGEALVQSYARTHPILQAIIAENDRRFYTEEIERRRYASAPPFSRYFGIIISSTDFAEAMNAGRKLVGNAAPLRDAGIEIFGPVAAPIARIRGRARVRILLKAPRALALHDLINRWRNQIKSNNRLRIAVDVDPQNFL